MRELAARAGTDAAIIVRLFGSKEALFREIADTAFDLEAAFKGPPETMGQRVAALLLAPAKAPIEDEFDAFRFLLASATSPIAAAIVSDSLHTGFVKPLATRLEREDAEGRATLITACVLGLTMVRFALASPTFAAEAESALCAPFAAAIQACIDVT